MYTLTLYEINGVGNKTLFYDDTRFDEEYKILSATLNLEENSAGSLNISIPPTNVSYGMFVRLETAVIVRKNGRIYWEGRVSEIEEDIWNCLNITCEGSLTYLNDFIHPYFCYEDPELLPSQFAIAIIEKYSDSITEINSGQGSLKQFSVGTIDITEDNNADKRIRYVNYESTFEIFKKLIEEYGGYIYVTYEEYQNEYIKRINWTDQYRIETNQTIKFGENMLDYSSNMSINDFYTSVIPLGKRLEYLGYDNVELYTTCKSDSWLFDYVYLDYMDYPLGQAPDVLPINRFGNIEVIKKWEDVSEPEELVKLAKKFLKNEQFDRMKLEISAFDMSLLDSSIGSIELSEMVRVISPYHGLDRIFPVTKMSINLTSPEASVITLGGYIVRDGLRYSSKNTSDPSITNATNENASNAENLYDEANNTNTTTQEYYPSGGWETAIIDDVDVVNESWTHLSDKDYRITKPGWYILEGIIKAIDRTDGDQGVAIGIGQGWECPGTLDGQSWRFEPLPPVTRSLEIGTNEFYLDFLIWNPTSSSRPLYQQYALMKKIRIDVNNDREATLIRFYISNDDPSCWPQNMPNGYIDVYTDTNGWLDASTTSRRREIVYIFGGRDNENDSLIKFFAFSGFWEILTLDISDQGYIIPNLSLSICKNFVLFDNMADKGLETSRTYEYRDVWFSCRGFPGSSSFHNHPNIDCIGVRITEKAGVGVTKLEYISRYDGSYVTVYTDFNKWINTNYRYIMIWYHAGRDSNDTFSQFLAHNSNQWFDLWGTRWTMDSLPSGKPSGYFAGSARIGAGGSWILGTPISLDNEWIQYDLEDFFIIKSITGGEDADNPNFINWLNMTGLEPIENRAYTFKEIVNEQGDIASGDYNVIGIITNYYGKSVLFNCIRVVWEVDYVFGTNYLQNVEFLYVYSGFAAYLVRAFRQNAGDDLHWVEFSRPSIEILGGEDLGDTDILSWISANSDPTSIKNKWALVHPNRTSSSNKGLYYVNGYDGAGRPFNFINIGDENSIKVGYDRSLSSVFENVVNFKESGFNVYKINNMSDSTASEYLSNDVLPVPIEFEFGSTSLFTSESSSKYMDYAESIELMSEVATLTSRRYMKPWYFIITMHLINLVAKKEISSYMIEQDTIKDIHTSCVTYLRKDDAVCLYGKAVAQGEHRTILKIHGPIA